MDSYPARGSDIDIEARASLSDRYDARVLLSPPRHDNQNDDDDRDDEYHHPAAETQNLKGSSTTTTTTTTTTAATRSRNRSSAYPSRLSGWAVATLLVLTILALTSLLLFVVVVTYLRDHPSRQHSTHPVAQPATTTLAFGSCTRRYANLPQPTWASVARLDPDLYVHLGDLAYVDTHDRPCPEDVTESRACYQSDPDHAAVLWAQQIANPDFRAFLGYLGCDEDDYHHYHHGVSGLPGASRPRPLAQCTKPFLATWDDHDFGANNGNSLSPHRAAFQDLYLDVLREPPSSPRRNHLYGIYEAFSWTRAGTFRDRHHDRDRPEEGTAGNHDRVDESRTTDELEDEIDIILLDERSWRSPLPCHMRRNECAQAAQTNVDLSSECRAWYGYIRNPDFAHPNPNPNITGDTDPRPPPWILDPTNPGTCCAADEQIRYGWCVENKNHPDYAAACLPRDPAFGTRTVYWSPTPPEFTNPTNLDLRTVTPSSSSSGYVTFDASEVPTPVSGAHGFCEVLGPMQRAWLQDQIVTSRARLLVLVSPSVLLGNPLDPQRCGGLDDFDCYPAAREQILGLLDQAPGCVLIATGDYHVADLKVLTPEPWIEIERSMGTDDELETGLWRDWWGLRGDPEEDSPTESGGKVDPSQNKHNDRRRKYIYQGMASGMTDQGAGRTAEPGLTSCNAKTAGFPKDVSGLRVRGGDVVEEGAVDGNDDGTGLSYLRPDPCFYYDHANFGALRVDWEGKVACVEVRGASRDGKVGTDPHLVEAVCFELRGECRPTKPTERLRSDGERGRRKI